MIEPASKLRIALSHQPRAIQLHYQIDDAFDGTLQTKLPFEISGFDSQLAELFGLCGSLFIAQLCLAKEVIFDFPLEAKLVDMIDATIRTLYAVRSYRDDISPIPRPVFKFMHPPPSQVLYELEPNRRATLLWSGGMDSTLSYLLLRENGYELIPLHVSNINGNMQASESELRSVQTLSHLLQADHLTAEIQFDQFSAISSRYSMCAGEYPFINPIPHGRELLVLPIAVVLALLKGTSNICFGFENSGWTDTFEYEGQVYSRYDTQSEFCVSNLQDLLRRFISPNLSLFSPIAPITEYRKLNIMLSKFPVIAQNTSFCYWGKTCGSCQKCSLYYTIQRGLGLQVIRFERNPIAERTPIYSRAMLSWNDPTFRDRNFALAQIVKRGDLQSGEDLLIEFEKNVLPKIEGILDKWQNDLMATRTVGLLPADFAISF